MKKIFPFLAAASLALAPSLSLSKISSNTNLSEENFSTINELKINHTVKTKKSGTQTKKDEKEAIYSTKTLDWNGEILNTKYAIAHGTFNLGTYKKPKTFYSLSMDYNPELSESNKRVWTSNDNLYTNDQWTGWGHQTSRISLKLSAYYNQKENITTFYLNSSIYARTAGSVHSCTTTSKVDSIELLSW
ncbi:hypothetical protein [Spiroplasma alleghenense]|uniref:Uncharacterized protein n=1 Tax=Spiroplasma alleghenense TaxID=216931 RepID=A0A345Z4L1_9MOLU|nr:hypothetical protein [Spiroplasma alleghenense]AXK51540.1 hypothetical protein SALLE_v1c08700 [Spiroplasma alleghenense]